MYDNTIATFLHTSAFVPEHGTLFSAVNEIYSKLLYYRDKNKTASFNS